MTNQVKKIIYAVSTLSGTIIGVGFFSLPYITLKVGFWVMLGYFLVLGSLVIIVHLFFGELSLKTPDLKRLPGFAKIHLGKWAEKLAFITTTLGMFGALLAYLLVGGEFLGALLVPFLGGNLFLYTLLYFALGTLVVYFGIRAIGKIEFWGLILFFVVLFLIFLKGKNLINIENLFIGNYLSGKGFGNFFFPYGPILFSLWGAALIPEVEEMLGETPHQSPASEQVRYGVNAARCGAGKKLLKKIIPIAILIPIFVYLFFIYLILGITGPQTTESALSGLRNVLGDGIVSLALCFGLLTTFTSFITIGLTLKKTLWYDLGIKKNQAWLISCFVPLILFLIGFKSFIPVISFIGGIMLGIDGILILLMYRKLVLSKAEGVRPKRKYLIYPLILVLLLIFLGGIVYEIAYFIR